MRKELIQFIFFGVQMSCISCHSQPNGISGKEKEKAADQVAAGHFNDGDPGGTILLARNGKIIYHKAFGKASVELNVPMQTTNVFRIASMTKQFVAVCILQLEEKGLLSLDDDIKKYIPDYPTGNYTITIRNLLTHTSGIKNLTSIPGYPDYMVKQVKLEELIAYFKNTPVEFEPGTKMSYSNSGYILLHYIIEKASGQKLGDYLNKNIFAPAGMNSAAIDEDNKIIKNKATGYLNNKLTADWMSMTQIACLVMSAEDMYKWHLALRSGKLVTPEHLKMAQTSFILKDGTPTDYGFGWDIKKMDTYKVIEHGGGISGYGGYEVYFPEADLFAVLLVNSQSIPEDLVLYNIMAVYDERFTLFREVKLPVSSINAFTGNYLFDQGAVTASIEIRKGKPFLVNRYPGAAWEIHFLNSNSFYVKEQFPFVYSFQYAADGKTITQIQIKGRGEYLEYAKKK